MPIEHDDEATSFDPRPWGAQQRLAPRSNFARISGTLQETSIPSIPGLVPAPATASALPVRMPAGTPPAPAPVVGHLIQAAPPALTFAASVAFDMPVFTAPVDSTARVHPAWTLRSFVAVPLGALVAVVVIVIGYRASTVTVPRIAGAAQLARSTAPLVAPVIAPTLTSSALAAAVTPAEAPFVPAPIAGVPSFVAPAAAEPTVAAVAKPTRAKPRMKKRPRKIVAVDASTPLGNLRPRRH